VGDTPFKGLDAFCIDKPKVWYEKRNIELHWTTNFYKNHVTELKLAISYQFLCAEHEYDSQIAKLALVFL